MPPAEIRLRNHIQIIVILEIQHRINRRYRRNNNRPRRQSPVHISIIRRFDLHVLMKNPRNGEISHGKFQCRTGLQRNALFDPVHINPSHPWFLIFNQRLLINNRSQRRHLLAGHAQLRQLLIPLLPELLILARHPVRKILRRRGPVHLIGIGNKHRHKSLRR